MNFFKKTTITTPVMLIFTLSACKGTHTNVSDSKSFQKREASCKNEVVNALISWGIAKNLTDYQGRTVEEILADDEMKNAAKFYTKFKNSNDIELWNPDFQSVTPDVSYNATLDTNEGDSRFLFNIEYNSENCENIKINKVGSYHYDD